MNLIKLAFVALLVVAPVSTFVGCGGGEDTTTPAATGSGDTSSTEGGSTETPAE